MIKFSQQDVISHFFNHQLFSSQVHEHIKSPKKVASDIKQGFVGGPTAPPSGFQHCSRDTYDCIIAELSSPVWAVLTHIRHDNLATTQN